MVISGRLIPHAPVGEARGHGEAAGASGEGADAPRPDAVLLEGARPHAADALPAAAHAAYDERVNSAKISPMYPVRVVA